MLAISGLSCFSALQTRRNHLLASFRVETPALAAAHVEAILGAAQALINARASALAAARTVCVVNGYNVDCDHDVALRERAIDLVTFRGVSGVHVGLTSTTENPLRLRLSYRQGSHARARACEWRNFKCHSDGCGWLDALRLNATSKRR